MGGNIFLHISVLLALTVTIAFVMRMLRQPLIVAYIVAGLIAGPLFLNSVPDSTHFFEAFAQFGIVLLLFVVGLSLNFDYIKRVGKTVFLSGTAQFAITALLGFGAMQALGFSLVSSVFVAIAITFSSTIVVVKLLSDKKDLESVYGRHVTGLLVIQDLIAVSIMIFLTSPGGEQASLYTTLGLILGKIVLLAGVVILMAKYVLPMVMDHVASSSELLFIFTIAWCFGLASLVHWAGFSVEIGAVIAGISLGASPYQKEISSRIRPLRDFFIVLFFIVLGSELHLGDVKTALAPGLILSAFVLIADPTVLYLVMRKMKHRRRTSFLAAITSAQVSEFGFILAFKGVETGYLQGIELAILTVVALITIVISSYLIEYNEQIYQRLIPFFHKFGPDFGLEPEAEKVEHEVWIFGYHRIGWKVAESLKEMKKDFAVVDFDPSAVSRANHRGLAGYFGDAADVEFLGSLPLEKAKLIISTLPEADDQETLVKHVRSLSDKPLIVANLYHNVHLDDLYKAGANYVMMPHLLGGSWMSEILKEHPWTKKTYSDLRKEQRQEMKRRFTLGMNI